MNENTNVSTISLAVQQYCASMLLSAAPYIHPDNVETIIEYSAERLAYQIAIMLRVPGEPTEERILAQYPDGLGAYILDWAKRTLPYWFTKRLPEPKMLFVRQAETVVYPSIPVPTLASKARIAVVTSVVPYKPDAPDA